MLTKAEDHVEIAPNVSGNYNEIDICEDGSSVCSLNEKLSRCCNKKTDMCQGNIDSTKNISCDTGSWLKIDSSNIPYRCTGTSSDNENCWTEGKQHLSSLPHDEQQRICCTSRDDFIQIEQYIGIPYLISKAFKF